MEQSSNPQTSHPGRMEVITGPMFSGKSEELIRRLKRAQIGRRRVICFKPDLDARYHATAIASHSAQTLSAVTVATVEELKAALFPVIDQADVIGVDEVQFFDKSLVPLSLELVRRGKRVILAGLDMTFAGRPFPPMPDLMAIADDVLKLSAVCMQCGAPAIHTQRLGSSQTLVMVGAGGLYEARCRACFQPSHDEQAAQLNLPTSET
jgi:thymidine kinase